MTTLLEGMSVARLSLVFVYVAIFWVAASVTE